MSPENTSLSQAGDRCLLSYLSMTFWITSSSLMSRNTREVLLFAFFFILLFLSFLSSASFFCPFSLGDKIKWPTSVDMWTRTQTNWGNYETRGPRATTRSPEWNHHCRYADGMQHFSNTVKYWNLWQDNGLNSFWDILLTRLKCWNLQNAISKKKFRYFSEVIWFIYLSCPLKVFFFFFFFFFFSIFSSSNHFVQQSRTILAILVKGNKRNISVKWFWN